MLDPTVVATLPSKVETQILLELSYGKEVVEIAPELELTEESVAKLINAMLKRYGLRNDCHLLATAFKRGWIE